MSNLRFRKELDDYLSRRASKTRPAKTGGMFKFRQFQEHHETIRQQDIQSMQNSNGNGVLVVDSGQQNFFSILHDKIMDYFRKKKQNT